MLNARGAAQNKIKRVEAIILVEMTKQKYPASPLQLLLIAI
jgi:hypothetical protein